MAMQDSKTLLSEDVALPSTATTAYTTDELDLGAGKDAYFAAKAHPDIGHGTPLWANFVMTAAAASSGSGTLAFNIVHGAATAPTTKLLELFTGLAAGTLAAGYKRSVALPAAPSVLRFVRGQLVSTTAGFENGTYTFSIDPYPLADV